MTVEGMNERCFENDLHLAVLSASGLKLNIQGKEIITLLLLRLAVHVP